MALAVVSTDGVRLAAATLAVVAGLMILRSVRCGRAPAEIPLMAPPAIPGGLYLGRGFEWMLDAAQETIEQGRPARRTERSLVLPDAMLNQHVLVLNRLWQAVNVCTVRRALTLLFQGHAHVVLANDDGSFATLNFNWPLVRTEADPEAVSLFEEALATLGQESAVQTNRGVLNDLGSLAKVQDRTTGQERTGDLGREYTHTARADPARHSPDGNRARRSLRVPHQLERWPRDRHLLLRDAARALPLRTVCGGSAGA
jgi:hypothetical protein